MPYSRKPRTRKPRRRNRATRSRRVWNKRYNNQRPHKSLGNGMPDRLSMMVKYNQQYVLDTTNSVGKYIQIEMNDPVAPQIYPLTTVDGAQLDPHTSLYIEDMIPFYNFCVVESAFMLAKFTGVVKQGANFLDGRGIKIVSLLSPISGGLVDEFATNPALLSERPGSRQTLLMGNQNAKSIKVWYKKTKTFPKADQDSLSIPLQNVTQGSVSQFPLRKANGYIYVTTIDPNCDALVECDLRLWQRVTFFDRRQPGLSDLDDRSHTAA